MAADDAKGSLHSTSANSWTRNQTRRQMQIARALAEKGYTVTSMEWSPVGGMVEMQGREGGWFVFADPDDQFVGGFSVAEVLARIEDLPDV